MAYDEALAQRVRDLLAPREELTEREMFGGIAFMLAGNMACGVIGGDLLVRLGKEDAERALGEPHVRPMDFTGRPMKTTVYVDPEARRRTAIWPTGSTPAPTLRRRCRPSARRGTDEYRADGR
jgi:TfoX/Sxy family transcriptional regulator of competence genes